MNGMKTALITDASGCLGSRVGRKAKEKGCRVRVLIRKPEQIERLGFTPDDVRIALATPSTA
jgi:nucleoside-diphosphate-sugar epimerase